MVEEGDEEEGEDEHGLQLSTTDLLVSIQLSHGV